MFIIWLQQAAHFADIISGGIVICHADFSFTARIGLHTFAGGVLFEPVFAKVALTSQVILRFAIGAFGRTNASCAISICDHRRRTFAASTIRANTI